jgi:hypothetical protein
MLLLFAAVVAANLSSALAAVGSAAAGVLSGNDLGLSNHGNDKESSIVNTTVAYFQLMKAFLGPELFAQYPCLQEQERDGWASSYSVPLQAGDTMPVFTLGVEGAGHHAIEVYFTGGCGCCSG